MLTPQEILQLPYLYTTWSWKILIEGGNDRMVMYQDLTTSAPCWMTVNQPVCISSYKLQLAGAGLRDNNGRSVETE